MEERKSKRAGKRGLGKIREERGGKGEGGGPI